MSIPVSFRVSAIRPDALVPVHQQYPVAQQMPTLPCAFFSLPRSGVLFDLDGTLVESKMIWWHMINQTSIDLGYGPLVYEEWEQTYGQSMEANRDMFFPRHSQLEADEHCYSLYGRYIEHLHILPGAEATLEAVLDALGGDKTRMAICTNGPYPITKQVVARCPMLSRFFSPDRVFCAGSEYPVQRAALHEPEGEARLLHLSDLQMKEELANPDVQGFFTHQMQPKPSPDMLHHACGVLGMRSDEIVFVGDSRFDLMAAVNAGAFGVGLGDKASQGHMHVQSIKELGPHFHQQ